MIRKYFFLWCFAVLALAGFLFYSAYHYRQSENQARLYVNGTAVNLEIADTDSARTQGLSGRASLAPDQGMLFVFPAQGFYAFWMKDMNFPIDMIWIGADYKIVSIKENAAPESYPQTFTSSSTALYVLEVPAGFAKAHGLIYNESVSLIQK